ncbi:MAG: hypothetical protein M0004_00290 [Actinomycetota bacterium]|nr:hypothetical protein [Actinomycetota bacterium]
MTTATSTSTNTYTRTHTAAYLAEAILGTISEVLAHLGIPTSQGSWDLERDERAIAAWYEEGSLKLVALECHQPDGTVAPVFEFPVTYSAHPLSELKAFQTDAVSLANFRQKINATPRGTTFRLFCSFNGTHSDQKGWSAAARASTDGLRSSSFGTIASGPHGSAEMRYLR